MPSLSQLLLPCWGVLAQLCRNTGIYLGGQTALCATMDGNWDTEAWVERQLMFWFCTSVAPNLKEHTLLCARAFYWVGQQEMSDCSRNLAGSLGTWFFPIIAAGRPSALYSSSVSPREAHLHDYITYLTNISPFLID